MYLDVYIPTPAFSDLQVGLTAFGKISFTFSINKADYQ